MEFFEQIKHQLYTYNYKIGNFDFFNAYDFIEAKHKEAAYEGKPFYSNLIRVMPVEGIRLDSGNYQARIFMEVVHYCKAKIDEIGRSEMGYNMQESNRSFFRFVEEHEALKRKYMIEAVVTREEAKENLRLIEGQPIRRNPDIPDNPKKAFELFKEYYARVQFLYQKDYFFNKYRVWID